MINGIARKMRPLKSGFPHVSFASLPQPLSQVKSLVPPTQGNILLLMVITAPLVPFCAPPPVLPLPTVCWNLYSKNPTARSDLERGTRVMEMAEKRIHLLEDVAVPSLMTMFSHWGTSPAKAELTKSHQVFWPGCWTGLMSLSLYLPCLLSM